MLCDIVRSQQRACVEGHFLKTQKKLRERRHVHIVAGFIAYIAASHLNYRKTLFIGGTVASLAQVFASFTNNYTTTFILLSIVNGFFLCLCYNGAVMVVAQVVSEKHRSKALIVVYSGSGVMLGIFPVVFELLKETYGFKGALLLLNAFTLQAIPLSLLMPAVKPLKVEKSSEIGFFESFATIVKEHALKSPKMHLLAIGAALPVMCSSSIYSFMTSILLKECKLENKDAATVATLAGVALLLGKLCVVFWVPRKHLPRWVIFAIFGLFLGFMTFMVGSVTTFGKYGVIFAILTAEAIAGSMFTISTLLVTDFYPLELFYVVYSYQLLGQLCSALSGPLITGTFLSLRALNGVEQIVPNRHKLHA